ncbi:hypothetical protein B0H14DRAFT_3138560 [Mycena olivaceomarginata]|nr:hypothetical protein B0H14DRAFT_3138560 [Mycena olivaceomarginata]
MKSKKTKGKGNGHGGERVGAGRPPNPNKAHKINQPSRVLGQPLRWSSRHRPDPNVAPAAFFRPNNTNQPAPLLLDAPTAAAQSRGSGGSAGPSHPGTTTAFYARNDAPAPTVHRILPNDWAQLNSDLNFLANNDEHVDIAAGNTVIDESLVNEALDSMEPSSEALVAETQAAEVVDKSELHKQLVLMKQEIDQEIDSHGQPLCYLRGDFFHRPRHPVFALHNSVITGLDPTQLYLCRVIMMIQLHAVSEISRMTFFCTQIDLYVMLDGSMTLDAAPVGKAAFPAYISAQGAISKLMMRLMRNTFSTRMGPAPFSEMVSEIQHLSHADGELMYTAAANFYGQVGLKQYSAFDDPNGYAGSPPSIPYLKGLFTDVISAHRIFIERDIATKPLTVAKADHTFDVLKHMGGVKGERIFTAAYTVINEFEEVRGHSLTLTKSLEFVKDMFAGIQQGLQDSQNPPTQILYTDSPQVTDWTDYPHFQMSLDIPTVSISDSMEIEAAAHEILQDFWNHSSQSQLYLIALAIKAEHRSGATPHLHVIQCRTRNKSYSFKVTGLTSPSHILPSLRAILTNMSIIKVGHEIRQTLQTISQTFGISEIEKTLAGNNPPLFDLGKLQISLHDLAGIVLQKCFTVPQISSESSPWVLPTSEFLFTELDCLWSIYISLSSLDSVGLPVQPIQARTHGQLVTLVQASMDDEGHTKRVNVSSSRSLIRISKVLVPGAIHSLHKQTLEWIMAHGGMAVVTTSITTVYNLLSSLDIRSSKESTARGHGISGPWWSLEEYRQ